MKKTFIILSLLFCFGMNASEAPAQPKKTICLNMIVKNESKVITRCIDSVLPLIDTWVIDDTGSTDGTQDIIRNHMAARGIPGQLYETPWVSFDYNRSEALKHAKGVADYVLIIDADETLSFDEHFVLPDLDKDFYHIMTHFGGTTYARVQLINIAKCEWVWLGVLHEYLHSPQAYSSDTLPGVYNVVFTDGARSADPLKYHKDAQILENDLKKDPTNKRTVFYLAQSYRDAGVLDKALGYYQQRIAMGGWDQEIFWSMLQVARIQQWLEMPEAVFEESFYKAYQFRPTRLEPLHDLIKYYRLSGNFQAGYNLGQFAKEIPLTKDNLFVEKWMYDYGFLLEYSICAFYIGEYEESQKICKQILAMSNVPENVRECVSTNLIYTNAKLLTKPIKRKVLAENSKT